METRRLERSRTDRMIFGVCGGLANYFGIDSVLVRLIFVVVAFGWGVGVIAYIVMAIVMPEQASPAESGTATETNLERSYVSATDRRATAGLVLVVVGLLFLLSNLGVFWWFDWHRFWPIILIAVGAAILLRRERR